MNPTNGGALVGTMIGAVLVLAISVSASAANAQSRAATSEAHTLFQQGEAEYRVGNYESAVDLWQRAYASDPRPRIQYNLSQAFERLGRLQEAVDALDAYVRATPPDDPLYGEANARLSALRQRVALTGIRVIGGATGSQIFVDGQPWGATPRPDRIPVAPGNHHVTVIAPDGTQREIAVAVPVGQVVDVSVPSGTNASPVLTFEDPSGAGGPGGLSGAPSERPRGHALLFTGIGVGGAGVLVLVYGIGRQVELGGCSDAGYACLEESTVSRQRTLGLALGATLVAAGGALVVVDLLRSRSSDSTEVELGVGTASLSLTVRR